MNRNVSSKCLIPAVLFSLSGIFSPVLLQAGGGEPTLIAWNNLGMHCMDDDYSVFTILPPYNTVDAQFIDAQGHLLSAANGISVTYEAMADPDGSFNSTVQGKTNFWDYVLPLYGADVAPGVGIAGTQMPGSENIPQAMTFDATFKWFEGLGIPITPIDDAGHANPYPMFRLVARDSGGNKLTETNLVLPVSGEMDCRACHASGSGPEAQPLGGWVDELNDKRDFRLNILRLHDEQNGTHLYNSVVVNDTPILCASCHLSEALPGSGLKGVPPLTEAIHSKHATVTNPFNDLPLDDINNRTGCYTCHPGSETRCLRGAMGASVADDGTMAMQCQSCHGQMSDVGASTRTGWFDEPRCEQCHTGTATDNNGQIRYTSVFEPNGTPRIAVNTTFATRPNSPVEGVSLYRFSKGHGGLQCSACHGSTHAEYPSSHRNDNLQAVALQGHVGVISDCTACHATMPTTVTGGPHGMHPIGTAWVGRHDNYGESANCKSCHGSDYRGTVLSQIFADRTITVREDGQTKTFNFWRGQNVSCFTCHKREDNGQIGGIFTNNHAPVVSNAVLMTDMNASGGLSLNSSDSDGNTRTLRIVQQPQHGSVALSGSVATYFPDAGFAGPDSFTFAAFDGFVDSNLGIVSVNVGSNFETLDSDQDGILDAIEYALGLSPDFPTVYSAAHLETVNSEQFLTMSYPLGLPPKDATLIIEVSNDFFVWTPATILSNSNGLLMARDPLPVSVTGPRFIRARVNRL